MSINLELNTYDYLIDVNLIKDFLNTKSNNIILLFLEKVVDDLKNDKDISRLNFINLFECYINVQNNNLNKNTAKILLKTVFTSIKYFLNDTDNLYNIIKISYDCLSSDEIYLYMYLNEIINNYELFINIYDKINALISLMLDKTKNGACKNSYNMIYKLLQYINITEDLIQQIFVNSNNIDMINISHLFLDALNFKRTPQTVINQLENYTFKNVDKSSLLIMNTILIFGLDTNEDNINKITCLLLIRIINSLEDIHYIDDYVDKYLSVINNRINNISEEITKSYYHKLNQFLLKMNKKIIMNEPSNYNKQYLDDIVNIFNISNNYNLDEWCKYLLPYTTIDNIKRIIEESKNNKNNEHVDVELKTKQTHFNLVVEFGDKILFNFSKKSLKLGTIYGIIGHNSCGKSILFERLELNMIDNFFNKNNLIVKCIKLNKYNDNFKIGDDISMLNHINIIEKFGLNIDSIINNLNYFMKYRYELLKVIIENPDVIILDEPLINTDYSNTKWLNDFILNTSNITWVITSNNYDFINYTCTNNYLIHDNKLSKCDNIFESLTNNNIRLLDLTFPINFKDNTPLITLENVSNDIFKNAISFNLNIKSRIAITGANQSGKTNLINLLIGLNKPLSGNINHNKTMSLGYISQYIFEELIEHQEKTPIQYLYWRYKKGYDKITLYQDIINITSNDFVKLRKTHLINGQPRLINKLTGYRKLNDQNEFIYELSWLGLSDENNSWFNETQIIEMGLNTFLENKKNRLNRHSALDTNKLTDYNLDNYLNEWNIPLRTTIGKLSSSEKMRFILAATAWKNPDLIIIDEPTNYLDNNELINLSNFIKSYPGGIVIATNNEKFARQTMNIILQIYNGNINITSN
jgi:ATPase subunit of ABC transporter with duplicated ATPase domains